MVQNQRALLWTARDPGSFPHMQARAAAARGVNGVSVPRGVAQREPCEPAVWLRLAAFAAFWWLSALLLYVSQKLYRRDLVTWLVLPLHASVMAWADFYIVMAVFVYVPFNLLLVWALQRRRPEIHVALWLALGLGTALSMAFPSTVSPDDVLQAEPPVAQIFVALVPSGSGGLVSTRPVAMLLVVVEYARVHGRGRCGWRWLVLALWTILSLGWSVATDQLPVTVCVLTPLCHLALLRAAEYLTKWLRRGAPLPVVSDDDDLELTGTGLDEDASDGDDAHIRSSETLSNTLLENDDVTHATTTAALREDLDLLQPTGRPVPLPAGRTE